MVSESFQRTPKYLLKLTDHSFGNSKGSFGSRKGPFEAQGGPWPPSGSATAHPANLAISTKNKVGLSCRVGLCHCSILISGAICIRGSSAICALYIAEQMRACPQTNCKCYLLALETSYTRSAMNATPQCCKKQRGDASSLTNQTRFCTVQS